MGDTKSSRDKLIDYLDQKVFDPVVQADPTDFAETHRGDLTTLKAALHTAQLRYHNAGTAEKVREMFHNDLKAEEDLGIRAELRRLNLPTMQDIHAEFDRLCHDMGLIVPHEDLK